MKLFKGSRVVFSGGLVRPATLVVSGGKISEIKDEYTPGEGDVGYEMVVDAGDNYLMPGVVDTHVHVNEPGRTEWEGYSTATQAAAAGGITTIIDMPLDSIPSTTTSASFTAKIEAAQAKCHVDVGFWGGVVPNNQMELRPMLTQGICGFKCFMINSGVSEFECVMESDIRAALQTLQGTSGVLLFHAEDSSPGVDTEGGDPRMYGTFLASRPDSWEVKAIETVCHLCEEYGVKCHIVHLATAEALPVIQQTKKKGAKLTVETTHHYLSLDAETVPVGATEYKCCPPIRSSANQASLWSAVQSGLIDMVVSDHSPCTLDLKLMEEGDFMKAWGGVASVQFGLSLFWTGCVERGLGLAEMTHRLCEAPSDLAGLSQSKGRIETGMDADFVIWDPDQFIEILPEMIYHKNKVTPYMNRQLRGKVSKTFVRGNVVYDNGSFANSPQGELILQPAIMSASL